jgi:glycosyltransferase involved in cell wall biosynthesis
MISVCIPTFNGEKFINQQLDSILTQLEAEDEIIISDDSSTDRTIGIIKSYNDHRIKLIENCKFKSPIFNLENALKQAKGEYIFLADQDDVWLSEKVKKLTEELKNANLVFSDAIIVDKDLKIVRDSFYKRNKNLTGLLKNIFFNNYFGATMAFRKELLKVALPFPKNIPMHDQWLGLVSEIYFKNEYIPEPLILYRRHGSNASYASERSKNSLIKKILFRVLIFLALANRIIKNRITKSNK